MIELIDFVGHFLIAVWLGSAVVSIWENWHDR